MHQEWPKWAYGPNGESAIFEKAEDIPAGWQDHPNKFKPKVKVEGDAGDDDDDGDEGENSDTGGLTREQIIADLERRKIKHKANASTKSLYRLLSNAVDAE